MVIPKHLLYIHLRYTINKMKKYWKQLKNKHGFTLIEVILYLAIVGILLVAVVNFHFTLGGTTTKVAANVDVSNNKRTAISAIEYLIRNSDGMLKDVDELSCSDLVSDPPSLALYFNNDDYLPGSCVNSGGGVKLTASSTLNRIVMECYPDIPNNGQYQACNTSVYGIGNTYYLTSPTTQVFPEDLNFSTSTATTTRDNFLVINSSFSVGNINNGQTSLLATSTASSTVVMHGTSFYDNAFTGWWKMNDDDKTTATNSRNANGTCVSYPTVVGGIVNGFTYAEDFEADSFNRCTIGATSGDTKYYFKDGFTLAAWYKPESFLAGENYIFSKYLADQKLGYAFGTDSSGNAVCYVCSGEQCISASSVSMYTLSAGSTYHLSCVYNPRSDDVIKVFVFLEGSENKSTTTNSTSIPLANYEYTGDNTDLLAIGTTTASDINIHYVDGTLNDLRAYERPLKDWEIWALQSRGLVAN